MNILYLRAFWLPKTYIKTFKYLFSGTFEDIPYFALLTHRRQMSNYFTILKNKITYRWWIVHQHYIHVCINIHTDTYIYMHTCTRTHTHIAWVYLPNNIRTLNIVITKHLSVTIYATCKIYKSKCT